MGMQCAVCGKKPSVGNQYVRSGKAKYLGGVGRKVRGCSKRTFSPNLQSLQCQVGGSVQRTARLRPVHPQRPGDSAAETPAVPDADQRLSARPVMSLKPEEVKAVARLARLELTEDELAAMTRQLGAILDYVAQLQQLNLDGVEPLAHCAARFQRLPRRRAGPVAVGRGGAGQRPRPPQSRRRRAVLRRPRRAGMNPP